MSTQPFKPKAYLKEGCPFSFKYYLFMVEAGLEDHIEVIRCNPNSPEFDSIKSTLSAGLGKPATFPSVEIEPGRYESDSDVLIEHFAALHGVNVESLRALAFYNETIFPQVVQLHQLKDEDR